MELPGGMEHPGILHLYCHLMELSNDPIAAMPAADILRHSFRHAGHLTHMASHIDIWAGHYKVGRTEGSVAVYTYFVRAPFRRKSRVNGDMFPYV